MRISQIILGIGFVSVLAAQPAPPATPTASETPVEKFRPAYTLGPGDQIMIRAFQVEEIGEKPYSIDNDGDLNLPLVGKIHAAGLTVDQFEAALTEKLKTMVRNPQVTVAVTQYRSEPIFITGFFKAPGIYPLQGRRTLLEMLAASGGLLPNASRKITITRHLEYGTLPLQNAVTDPTRNVSVADISLGSLQANINPTEDIPLKPMDTISADRAQMIYVNGEVNKVGSVELGERDSIPVSQVVTMVGGLAKDAAPDKAMILRQVLASSKRAEIPVHLKQILSGKESDFQVLPNDMLYIPRSSKSGALSKASIVALPMASALAYVLASKL